MQTINQIDALRTALEPFRRQGKRIGFVPTMGNLHDGHLSLIRKAQEATDVVVCSIFVNPMQFGQNEDLDAYPRTLENDKALLISEDTHFLFAPTVRDMYPLGVSTQVSVPVLSNILCGASRPGHFTGVATICAKLFNIVQPTAAFFGEKDFQQLTIIRHMVEDLCMPLEIVGVPTGRADDGLALSSRNGYLSENERQRAPAVYRALTQCAEAILAGNHNYALLEKRAASQLDAQGFKTDYFRIMSRPHLEPANLEDSELIILVAAQLGKARLIDNLQLQLER